MPGHGIHFESAGGPLSAPLGSDNFEVSLHGVTNHPNRGKENKLWIFGIDYDHGFGFGIALTCTSSSTWTSLVLCAFHQVLWRETVNPAEPVSTGVDHH